MAEYQWVYTIDSILEEIANDPHPLTAPARWRRPVPQKRQPPYFPCDPGGVLEAHYVSHVPASARAALALTPPHLLALSFREIDLAPLDETD